MTTVLNGLLPKPHHSLPSASQPRITRRNDADLAEPTAKMALTTTGIPPYRARTAAGFAPRIPEHFGDGGAFPEILMAQYPLDMGRKNKKSTSNALALQTDAQGNVLYDALAKHGHNDKTIIKSQFKDIVPLHERGDVEKLDFARPSEDVVAETTEKTRAALEKIVNGKISAAKPKTVTGGAADNKAPQYIRYTPGQQGEGFNSGAQQRIIRMVEAPVDPLDPPKFKHKKVPAGPPSPPAPVLHSPPRKVSAKEQAEWVIPPCISNWKNAKGYTIPLDKRLAADGRGLQEVQINDNFAKFTEALHAADRHAREEVRQRSIMQQKLAAKEKAAKEENLRALAQKAREERAGFAPSSTAPIATSSATNANDVPVSATRERERERERDRRRGESPDVSPPRHRHHPSRDSRSPARQRRSARSRSRSVSSDREDEGRRRRRSDDLPPRRRRSDDLPPRRRRSDDRDGADDDVAAAEDELEKRRRERDEIRRDRQKQREREIRMTRMGTDAKAKYAARETDRSISEKVALGIAKPTMSKDSMFDQRLFNQTEGISSGFKDDDAYAVYDKALFANQAASSAIYRPKRGGDDGAGDMGTEEDVNRLLSQDRFGNEMTVRRGFQGADASHVGGGSSRRDGPVAFEKEAAEADPFGHDEFLSQAKKGKRALGLDASDVSEKRSRND